MTENERLLDELKKENEELRKENEKLRKENKELLERVDLDRRIFSRGYPYPW